MSGEKDPLVVYLVVRQSDDCAPNMVEIIGACMTRSDADALREYEFERTGRQCHVKRLRPEPDSTETDDSRERRSCVRCSDRGVTTHYYPIPNLCEWCRRDYMNDLFRVEAGKIVESA